VQQPQQGPLPPPPPPDDDDDDDDNDIEDNVADDEPHSSGSEAEVEEAEPEPEPGPPADEFHSASEGEDWEDIQEPIYEEIPEPPEGAAAARPGPSTPKPLSKVEAKLLKRTIGSPARQTRSKVRVSPSVLHHFPPGRRGKK